MNKAIITIIVSFVAILLVLVFFRTPLISYFGDNTSDVPVKKDDGALVVEPVVEPVVVYTRDFDAKIAQADKILLENKNLTKDDVAGINISKAFDQLAKRDESSIIASIAGFKAVVDSDTSNQKKAKALEKLAGLYWRTGGSEIVFREVYSGEYKKYADQSNGSSSKTAIALYKKSYEVFPTPRAAIEIAYYYTELAEYVEAKKWLSIAENFESKSPQGANYFYKKYLTYTQLAKSSDPSDVIFKDNFSVLYNKVLSELQKDGKAVYGHNHGQTLPFLYMFQALALSNLENKNTEINDLLSKAVDYIEGDPHPELNEFLYFLNVQKDKKERDLLGKDLNNLANISPKFKAFLEKYGFVITNEKK